MDPIKARELIEVLESEFNKDEETGKMTGKVVIIKAGRAKNPRKYRPGALQKAVKEGIYNGLPMFVDHSDKPPTKRQFMEMVSVVESTEWDPKRQAIVGNIEFIDADFFDRAQKAKKYVGVSADHSIRVNYVKEGQKTIQDVLEIDHARSVDWVLFPSAGGEILSFARESEGADQVEWNEVTLDQLKEHAPQLVEQLRSELTPAKEQEDPDPKEAPKVEITPEAIAKIVADQVSSTLAKAQESEQKRSEARKSIAAHLAKSGLPARVQTRLVTAFEGVDTFDQTAVDAAIADAKEELKELGVGPKISGMGPTSTTGSDNSDPNPKTVSVMEAVESFFGKKPATSEKES